MSFTPKQVDALKAPLDRANVRQRAQAGRKLNYLEGWKAIEEANRIFGFSEWSSQTVETRCVSEASRKIGQQQKDGHSVSYIARVRVEVITEGGVVVREGVGAGHGIDVDLGLAHESAIKESETDARKRALMTFGNPFGLALYDKDQTNVADAPPEPPPFVMPAKQMLHEIGLCATPGDLDSLKADDGFRRGFKACSPDERRQILSALSPVDGEEQAA